MKVYYKPFLNSSQIFKVAIGRNIFSKKLLLVYVISTTFFDKYLLFHAKTGKCCFSKS